MRPVGKCKLCLNILKLAESHFFARAFYKRLKDAEGARKTIRVTEQLAQVSDRQISDYLLCDDCERLLKVGGEDHILSICRHESGRFPFCEKVKCTPGIPIRFGSFHRLQASPELNPNKIIYFAASILWRWAVHDWKFGDRNGSELGKYEEMLRQYLLLMTEAPPSFQVLLWVLENEPGTMMSTPVHFRLDQGVRGSKFTVPGLRFIALTSNHIPETYRAMSVSSTQGVGLFLRDADKATPDRSILTTIKESRRSFNLCELMNKLDRVA